MDLDRAAPAGDLLTAQLLAAPRAGRWAAIRFVLAGALLALLDEGAGAPNPPSVSGFLTITRRDTGATLLRADHQLRPATDTGDAEFLAYVHRQLDELTVGEFLDRWGIDPGDDDPPSSQ